MKLKEFKFSDSDVKKDIVRSEKILKKSKFAFNYLLKYLPINKLNKDNSFNFDKIKFNEGKNYDWYFLNNKSTKILVRQYRTHFTFFVDHKNEEYYKNKFSIFTIHDNDEKMDDETNDRFCDDNFRSISEYLPKLVELIEDDNVHSLWNNLSFPRPKYTDVKLGMNGKDHVESLDVVIFASDELFSIYSQTYSENDTMEMVKKFKVGDKFGSSYIITKVKTEFPKQYSDPYYHGIGLEFSNTNFPDSKPKWADVYSLTSFYYDELDYDFVKIQNEVMKFVYKNHQTILNEITKGEQNRFAWMNVEYDYIEKMHKLYDNLDVDLKVFHKCIEDDYRTFIKTSYRITQS